jgi:hypothetical protein
MRILCLSWTRNPVQERPYAWTATEPGELFTSGIAEELSASFPMTSFIRFDTSNRDTGKTYRNYSRELVAPEGPVDLDLPPRWRDIVEDLISPEYRKGVAHLLGQPHAAKLEIRLVRHSPGDWLGPHTDRADKIFSHVVYFNPIWREEWGGCIEILDSAPGGAAVARVVPRLGASVLIEVSDRSWHQVSKVVDDNPTERRSLLIHGLRG